MAAKKAAVKKRRFPKPDEHPTRGANPKVEEAQVEEVSDDKVEVLPPVKREIKLIIDGNKTHIDMGGCNLLEGLTYIKLAHSYLFDELTKAVALNEGNDKQEGSTNTPSESNS